MYDDAYPNEANPVQVDERVDLMQRIVGLEQAERQQRERSKEANAKLDAIRGDYRSAISALTKALEQTGVLPTTGTDQVSA